VRWIEKIDTGLAKLEATFIVATLSVMILLSFGQVILRNFFQGGILWADLFLRQAVLWVGFLGASLATREGRHISIEVMAHFLPRRWVPLLARFVQLAAAAVSAALAHAAFRFVRMEREAGSALFLDIPGWVFQVILPYCFTVIALRFLLMAAGALPQAPEKHQ
jgi:TRAP-type C4-dicarboxylate transport system permease small subunit